MCDRRLRGKIGMSSPLNEKEDGGEKMEKIVEGQSVWGGQGWGISVVELDTVIPNVRTG